MAGAFLYYGWNQSESIINPPRTPLTEEEERVSSNPLDYGLILNPFEVAGDDGTSFRACLIQAAPPEQIGIALRQSRMKKLLERRRSLLYSPLANKRGTIILSHAAGQRMEDMYRIAEYLTAARFDCLVYDMRAHGTRSEEVCMYGEKEKHDIALLIEEARKQFGDLGSIGALGIDLGAAVTLQAAPLNPDIRSVVSINSFATLKETIWHQLMESHGKLAAYAHYFTGDQILAWRMGFHCYDIAPVASATRITVPAFVVTTRKDSPFYSESAQKIHTALASREKVLYTPYPTDDSRDYSGDEEELYATILEWLSRHNHPPVPEVMVPVRRVPLPQSR